MTFPAQQRSDLPFTPELMRKILLRTADMPGADYRVLSYYVTEVPLGQTIRVPAKDVSQAVKVSAPSVSRSIKRLKDAGWLEVSYRVGSISFYRAGPLLLELAAQPERPEDDGSLATVSHLPNHPDANGA